ncbi:hypothetical protein DCAR_0314233 [Daucus carota subsp. sativus]|uniref:Leucine-rich repeat-containing N-terminal plant-type domain-containing protein n=2 Tax=Daucus carota subsp. sativus TaxID=79200 RepID=A0AAF1AWF4_DAUCS|nr:hypothetical protein DCAR_0314233 [Daucus carota subsp. sativus]
MNINKLADVNTRNRGSYYDASVSLIVKGTKVEVRKILNIYTSIDLSSNKFTGEIPEAIGELKSFRMLNLSHNDLRGSIPSLMGNMTLLEALDLSSNQLTGTIPRQLTNLTFLGTLNLSQNHLSGPIPRGSQFNSLPNDSYQGNLALCGFPLTEKCKKDEPPTLQVEDEDDDDDDQDWFSWKIMVSGYFCGLVCGLSSGYIAFTTGKPRRIVIFIEGAQQKFIRRYMKISESLSFSVQRF